MTATIIRRPRATVEIDGTDHHARRNSHCRLDAGAVRYGSAEIELPLLDDSSIDWLDPDAGVRVPVTFTPLYPDVSPRVFDLGLRSRLVDHDTKTVTLRLSTDEALLQDHSTLAVDTGARAHEASARAVVDYALAKIGASLEPGTDDADVTAYWPLTNYCTNPRAETTTGFTTGANVGSWGVDTTTGGWSGPNYVWWRSSTAGESYLYAPAETSVTPRQDWISTAWFNADGSGRTARLILHFLDVTGAIVGQALGANVAIASGSWAMATVQGTAPVGAVRVRLIVLHNATAGGQATGVDGILLTTGTEAVPFFSGAGSLSAGYTVAWTAGADESTSTRTPVVERRPELFTQKPGVKSWDFLAAITSAVGLVLWCDEQRRWHLAFPENRTIAAQINLSDANSRAGTDELSRDDEETFVTGVVVHYTWRDADEASREAYDTAGTDTKVLTIEMDRPYPGPGAAAAILARRQGTGRVQKVTAAAILTTTPGMSAQISLPGAPDTLGRVTAVDFHLADGFMDVDTSGLIDVGLGDWFAENSDTDWTDTDSSLDWEDA